MPGDSVMNNEHEMGMAGFADDQHEPHIKTAEPQPSGFWAALLSPRTLQILMLSGGGVLVLGLVIWLWAQGVFENSLVTAVTLGVTNVVVLALGVASVRHSRYQMAGMALTILACLVLPLNLWFYDAQGLVTLDQGGHLWVAALICCSLYVVVAWIVANPVFVYPIVGGVALTGLLFLADQQVGRFWEITSPSALLMVLGMISIHAERLFPVGTGPFARDKFGRAFFRAGHATLAAGLSILIVGHVIGWAYEPFFADLGMFPQPAVVTQTNLKIIALGLSLAAAYSYLYSQIVAVERGRYAASAVATLLWCGLIVMDLLAIPFTMEVAAVIAASGALLAALPRLFSATTKIDDGATTNVFARFTNDRSFDSLSTGLNAIATILLVCLYTRVRLDLANHLWPYQFTGAFVVATLLAAAASWLGSLRLTGFKHQVHLAAVALLGVFAVAGTLGTLGYQFGASTLVIEMLVPLTIVAFAGMQPELRKRMDWTAAAEVAAGVLLAVGCGVAFGVVDATSTASLHIWLTVFFAQTALCFGLASLIWFRIHSATAAAISVCGLTWQLLLAVGITQYVFLYATLLVAIVAMVVDAFTRETLPFKTMTATVGRICLSYGGVAAMLLAGARLLAGESHWNVVGLLAAYFTASGVAAWLATELKWRRHFTIMAVVELALALFTIGSLSTLHFAQRLELLVTAAGVFLLVVGVMGWRREEGSRDPLVSCNLAFGSLLSAAPMVIGLICHRLDLGWNEWGWAMFHELGVLLIGLALLGVGVLCRIRWSTITGAGTLAAYIMTLVLLIRLPDQLQTTAIYMMAGGGTFFVIAVLLSIYRDRLLALPQKVKAGEGMFEVFTWR
jgi:hypothetical protein